MNKKRVLITWLLLGLVLGVASACAPEPAPTPTPVKSNTVARPAPPTATEAPTATDVPTATAKPSNTATEEPVVEKPGSLTILHTNDVRGYVDPCG